MPFSAGKNKRRGLYKFAVARQITEGIEKLHIDEASFATAGISKKMLKKKHINVCAIAATKLTELTCIKREQCVSVLKMLSNRLTSFAEAVLSTAAVQEKDKDKNTALLGLQCHHKGSEPYLKAPSYVNHIGYDFISEAEKFEEKSKSSKKTDLLYQCNDNCKPLSEVELTKLEKLLKEASCVDVNGFRRFIQRYHWCTKSHEYSEDERKDLDPSRMYMFPVKQKNHPEECYIPLPNKSYPTEYRECMSYEVLIRKAMVHYENGRKFHNIMLRAMTAHKMLCDIDTSTVLGDVEYLSKLVKIKLDSGSTVGFDTVSESRQWTSKSISEKVNETVPNSKKKKNPPTYKDVYDSKCSDLPKIKCWCCNVLCTPSKASTLNANRYSLKYDPEENKRPNAAYQQFHDFLIEKGLLNRGHTSEPDAEDSNGDLEGDDTNSTLDDSSEIGDDHPTKWLHGLKICQSCRSCLNKNLIPAHSLLNKMYTGECPEVLKVLNAIELMFVSKVKCFQTLIKPGPISSKLPDSERLSALQGHFIHLPLSLAATIAQLSNHKKNQLFDVEDLVHCYSMPKKTKKAWRHLVDRVKVFDALKWLIAHNKNYKDIDLPETPEDILPDVFGEDDEDEDTYKCMWCEKTEFRSEQEFNTHEQECKQKFAEEINDSGPSFDEESDGIADAVDADMQDINLPEDILPDVFGDNEDTYKCMWCDKTSFSSEQEFNTHVQDCKQKFAKESNYSKSSSDKEPDGMADNVDADMQHDQKSKSNTKKNDEPDKPWIKRMTKEELDKEYGHLTVMNVNSDSKDASELFRMLNVDSNPVPTYQDNLDCLAFPSRFPYGDGGRTTILRERPLNGAQFEKTHIMTSDAHARRNKQYLFFLAQQREMRTLKEGLFGVLNSRNNEDMTKEDVLNGAKAEDPELLKKLSNVLRKLPSQKEFWHDVKNKVEQMVFEYGPATIWATFSPGDYDDEDLHKYLHDMNDDLPNVDSMTTSQLISLDPVLACTYLQTKFDALLEYILSDAQPIGKVLHHFVRTEYQTRLMPHFHCFFWIEDAPIIGVDSPESVLEYIGKHICCKLPLADEDPVMHNLVQRFQSHRCNSYCLRNPKNGKGKARCKFSYPRRATRKPVLHSVVSSIVSHQSRSYQRRLYELERQKSEERINDYNPILLYIWKGNVDFQFIREESESLVDYICKYATKAPKSAIDEFHVDYMVDSSDYSKLMSMAMKIMKYREMEARGTAVLRAACGKGLALAR